MNAQPPTPLALVDHARHDASAAFQECTRISTAAAVDLAEAIRTGSNPDRIEEHVEAYRLATDARMTALGALEALEDLQRELDR